MTAPSDAPKAADLASLPDERRERARQLSNDIEAARDRIGELDLEIEDWLIAIAQFDAAMQIELRHERRTLDRIEALRRMLERWTVALEEQAPERLAKVGEAIEARRERELRARQAREAQVDEALDEALDEDHASVPPAAPPLVDPDDAQALKAAYRRLARRYHPDLARSEEDRLTFGRMMGRINAAYHERDLARLLELARSAPSADSEAESASLTDANLQARLEALEREYKEVSAVVEELEARRAETQASPSYRLWRRSQAAAEAQAKAQAKARAKAQAKAGGDFFAAMRQSLSERAKDAARGIRPSIEALEKVVERYNRRRTQEAALAKQSGRALSERFEPQAAERLASLLLDEMSIDRTDPVTTLEADRIEAMATDKPASLRLLLLAYVAQLSARPLPGLERHEDFALRFDHLGRNDADPVTLTEAMADLADLLEFGVASADAQRVRLAFRFRSQRVRDAMPLALLRVPVRRALRRVLQVLGEATSCEACSQDVFLVPLYRSTGFDSLRAEVCPACGHASQLYWLPRGDDVQALLNAAYLELELITEWSYELGSQRGATQLLAIEVDQMTLGELKQRIHTDLFERYKLDIRRGQMRLLQDGQRVSEKTPLAALAARNFVLAFDKKVERSGEDLANLLRHRIRHRFD